MSKKYEPDFEAVFEYKGYGMRWCRFYQWGNRRAIAVVPPGSGSETMLSNDQTRPYEIVHHIQSRTRHAESMQVAICSFTAADAAGMTRHTLIRSCDSCGHNTSRLGHIQCLTCDRIALCNECSPPERNVEMWRLHQADDNPLNYEDKIQCDTCRTATLATLAHSKMIVDLERLLYKSLFYDWK